MSPMMHVAGWLRTGRKNEAVRIKVRARPCGALGSARKDYQQFGSDIASSRAGRLSQQSSEACDPAGGPRRDKKRNSAPPDRPDIIRK